MATTISPQQRALNFGAMTRQHIQTLGSQTGTANDHMIFEVPKARLLQSINLFVKVNLKKATASTTTMANINSKMELYNVIRRFALDYNNGFATQTCSGKELAMLNMLRVNPGAIVPSAFADSTLCTVTAPAVSKEDRDNLNLASATNLAYYFKLDIPLTLNERDPSGLVLAQNAQTLINFSIDVADKVLDIPVDSIEVIPEIVSFSVPTAPEAFPDMSVLKIVDSRKETFTGGGSNLIKLPVGMIYRKFVFYLEDDNGNPIKPEDINGNFEILFNTADIPYSVNPQALRLRTVSQCGAGLPDGFYALDLSYQGVPNYGGSRDYIDAEHVTTLELRFTSQKSGKITIITEKISRLIASK